jgi:transcriptional regulator of acetoin/glycerol metabolism
LENALEFATTVCEGQTIHVGDLPVEIGPRQVKEIPPSGNPSWSSTVADGTPLPTTQVQDPALTPNPELPPEEVAEVARIRKALEQTQYRRSEAADLLGISRSTLWRKMKQYRI